MIKVTDMNREVCIIIPIYKIELSKSEEISLNRTLDVFGEYDIFFIAPASIAESLKDFDNIQVIKFANGYFHSVKDYNRLLLSKKFYLRFKEYKYILICQLDVYIFEDKLRYFCSLDYDYIGAPWLWGAKTPGGKYVYVGNGGLSLRKVGTCINLLEKNGYVLSHWNENEDLFFSAINQDDFKVAPLEIALKFATESNVRICFFLSKGIIPMGCHAWEKYDTEFLLPYFEISNEEKKELSIGRIDKINNLTLLWYVLEKDGPLHKVCKIWAKEAIFQIIGNKNVSIWGAGYYGKVVKNALASIGISINCFYDNNPQKQGKFYDGVLIKKASKEDLYDNYVIIAVMDNVEKIYEQIFNIAGNIFKNCVWFLDITRLLLEDSDINDVKIFI